VIELTFLFQETLSLLLKTADLEDKMKTIHDRLLERWMMMMTMMTMRMMMRMMMMMVMMMMTAIPTVSFHLPVRSPLTPPPQQGCEVA
jgi:hypothetical protein